MAATTRTITDTIYKLDGTPWEGATVRIDRVDRPMIDSDGTIGDSVVTGTTDANGDVSLTVAVPPSGAGRYRLTRPVESGQPVDVTYFYLAAGDAISVGEILAASASALTEDALLTLLSAYLSKANNLSDLASAATARTNLGLGTAATAATGDFEADLGNPDANGYVLSSTTGGTRSWVAQSAGASDVDDLTTTTGSSTDMLRVAAAGGLEYRTTAQVLSDIGAAPTASPAFTGTVTLPTTVASVIKPASDSTTALQLVNAAGSAVVTVDTTNKRIGIGTTPSYTFHAVASTATFYLSSSTASSDVNFSIVGGTSTGRAYFNFGSYNKNFSMVHDNGVWSLRGNAGTHRITASDTTGFVGINKSVPTAGIHIGYGGLFVESGDVVISTNVDLDGLPTSDPSHPGRLWNDSGTLRISL